MYNQIIQSIRDRMYNLYNFSNEELELVLHQTYKPNNSREKNCLSMVVKVSEEDSLCGLYGRQYNQMTLELVHYFREPWLHLSIYSIDDSMWRAFLPLSLLENQTFEQLWEEIKKYIFPNLTQEYFKEFTKEIFGANEYDWN